MTSIHQLPRAVHSKLRSSVVLFDLPRVVEELIYNSLDAGATKVNVSISVGECYVKVDDDGCGITRDGMGLLGEKYATSKLHCLAEMDVASGNFGFLGETLGSLSDVSLLEVTTKARGKPNGYRKIIKGCKCLYLGLDDNRQEMGTTVVVRELFYNQPVRRKYMHSSPKKVLHSVRECVLRVALVHSQVSFKVTDVQSGDQVLCTHPSPSPLPLVSSGFGIDVSSSLCKLDFSKGILKLSGYLSAPVGTCSLKALQYVYINSRFVCKGPLHKLLNNLADSSKCLSGFQNGKSRTQVYPMYILNLCCPRSNYDVTFEPSKTVVEFKDWVPVLSFIEQAVSQFWRQMPPKGVPEVQVVKLSSEGTTSKNEEEALAPKQDIFAADISVEHEISRAEHCLLHDQNFLQVASEGSDPFSHPKKRRPSEIFDRSMKRSKLLETMDDFHQMDYTSEDMFFGSWDAFSFRTVPVVDHEHCIQRWPPDNNSLAAEDNILSNEVAGIQTSKVDVNDNVISSLWDDFFEVDVTSKERSPEKLSSSYFGKIEVSSPPRCFKGLNKPFLRNCSLLGNRSSVRNGNANHKGFQAQSDSMCCTLRRIQSSDDMISTVDTDNSDQNLNLSPGTSLPDKFATASHPPRGLTGLLSVRDLNLLSPNFVKCHQTDEAASGEESDSFNNSPEPFGKKGSKYMSRSSAWGSASPSSLFCRASLEADNDDYVPQSMSCRNASSSNFKDWEMKNGLLNYANMQKWFYAEGPATRCTKIDLDYEYAGKYLSESAIPGRRLNCSLIDGVGCLNKSTREMDWLFDNSSLEENANNCATPTMHTDLCCYQESNNQIIDIDFHCRGRSRFCEGRSRRSHSAPPFYKRKGKFSTIFNYANFEPERESSSSLQETCDFKHFSAFCGASQSQVEPSLAKDSPCNFRASIKSMQYDTEYNDQIEEATGGVKHSSQICHEPRHQHDQDSLEDLPRDFRTPIKMLQYDTEYTDQIQEDFALNQTECRYSGLKWRNGIQQNVVGHDNDESHNLGGQSDILDIFSGFLHLAGSSVVPETISRGCLEDAKVLLQLDKKFIPVVAGGTLVVIDQHAADERIRLEELRNKILSGEGKSVAYLDSEQELVLPEVGYQLLQNYAEQIQNWGWICNDQVQGLESFTKNLSLLHRQTSVITLRAVPCILGVKLSDSDLLEYLEQLYETDGSSTFPPAVIRVLNYKACRGAIMFGDALLPSECSLIIEELKQTSLCFQCAHGRPTTVPLVNLETLHKQLADLNNWSDDPWHGLYQHKPTLIRARQRLIAAGG